MSTTAVVKRRVGRPTKHEGKLDFIGDFLARLRAEVANVERVTWPSPKYRNDPVGFAHDILGVELWSKQVEIIEGARDHRQVAVRGAQKTGKSTTAGCLALWYYCSFDGARVLLSATTQNQVERVLYRELRRLVAQSGRCVPCRKKWEALIASGTSPLEAETQLPRPCPHSQTIDGALGATAETGLQSGLRQVIGIVARNQESVAGISGANQLWLCDEASGMTSEFLQAASGNLAGGGAIVMISNPTRLTGTFFDAFHRAAQAWHRIHVSALDSPNVVANSTVIPGLATRAWLDAKKKEYGETSPFYRVRCLGEFPVGQDSLIFPLESITAAEARWRETAISTLTGRLWIGLDPAGPAGEGDESVFCLRRGHYVQEFVSLRGLGDQDHLEHLLGMITKYVRRRDPLPVVVIDGEGKIGAGLHGALAAHAREHKAFALVSVRASEKASRNPKIYARQRDELAANLETAFADGLAIPEDSKLSSELHMFRWDQRHDGRYTLSPPKEEVRKELQRSPDRFDALALACWEPFDLREGSEAATPTIQGQAKPAKDMAQALKAFGDPYRGGYRR